MIEVEKKFHVTPEQKQRLIADAEFVSARHCTEVYYDDAAHSLTTADRWLRQRDGAFELKARHMLESDITKEALTYDDLTEEKRIKNALGIVDPRPLQKALPRYGIEPFARLTMTRETYRKDGLTLTFDQVDFGFSVCAVELMAKSEADVSIAKAKIAAFATLYGLTRETVRGKVQEYVRRFRPEHFEALVRSGAEFHDQT